MIELVHRNIDFEKDRDYVLECHCRVNYACDAPWMRKLPYEDYRRQWFGLNSQITGRSKPLPGMAGLWRKYWI